MTTMKRLTSLSVITAASLWVLSGCDPSAPAPEATDTVQELGTAQLRLQDDTRAAAVLKVAARVAETGQLGGETTVKLHETAAVDLSLRPGEYVLDVEAFADAEARVLLSARSAKLKIASKVTAKVDVKIEVEASGAVGLGLSGPDIDCSCTNGGATGGATVGGGASAGGMASGSATASGNASASGAGGATGASATAGGNASATGGSTGASAGGMASATGGSTGASAGGMASATGGSTGASAGASAGAASGANASATGASTGASAGASAGAASGANASATGGSTGASAGATATASVPVVEKVDVVFGATKVKVSVKASASAGGTLQFVWSGAGFQGSVSGGASAELDVHAILTATTKTTKILVQSQDGLVAQVHVSFDAAASLLGALELKGTCRTAIVAAAALATSAKACVDVHATCTASCKASATATTSSVEAHAACMLACAVKLATCCQ